MEAVFSINGRQYKIDPSTVPIDTTLNTFIRSHARLTGTKFMCLEGGCGVCLVNISGVKTETGESRSFAVNSCLWLIYACHGLNVTTIEGIGNRQSGYHPIQNALYHFNGTQCGYCSPGMIMNMYSLLQANHGKVTMDQVENAFGGNICRCTGYRPILDAFKSLASDSCYKDIEDLTVESCRLKESCLFAGKCQKKAANSSKSLCLVDDGEKMWSKPKNLQELLNVFASNTGKSEYFLVAGNTAHGVYRRPQNIKMFIDVNDVPELHEITVGKDSLSVGANTTLTQIMDVLQKLSAENADFSYGAHLVKHIDLVATVAVRNAGTIAGNLSIKHAHNEFPSDIFLLLEAIGAQLNIVSTDGSNVLLTPKEYLSLDMNRKVLLNVTFPKLPPNQFVFRSYKIMPRAQNAHAFVNAAFLFEFETSTGPKKSVKSCRICYGGINPKFIHAEATEKLLTGIDDLYTNKNLQTAIKSLQSELQPDSVLPDPEPEYRRNLAIALLYRFFLKTSPTPDKITPEYRSGAACLKRPLSSGSQTFESKENLYPLTKPSLKYEGLIQCSGEALYANDLFSLHTFGEELWAAFVPAVQVHSKIVRIDASKALKIPGVHAFYSAKDIPGINSSMPVKHGLLGIIEAEEIFLSLESEILFHGQPCGIIVAKTMALANSAVAHIEIQYEKMVSNQIIPSLGHWREINNINSCKEFRSFNLDSDEIQKENPPLLGAEKKIKGDFDIGSQYHFSMEPQTTFCIPSEDGGLDVHCSTQFIDFVQIAISECLKIPENKINMVVKRMGGSYGAKISRSTQVACACALACYLTGRPVRFVLTIESNMTTVGKRYGCANEYDLVVDSASGRIVSLSNSIIEDYGCTMNDDVAFYTEEVFQKCNYGPTSGWKVHLGPVKTDAPSATYCRSPGTAEGHAMLENIMEHIAREINLDPNQVRLANIPKSNMMSTLLPQFLKDVDYNDRKTRINEFNKQNKWRKKGIAVSIMKYPIFYFGTQPAFVAIYHGDGTVVVSHGGTECGQGINTKVAQVAAYTLGISLNLINVKSTNNVIAANAAPTGGSITSESVCFATRKSCEILLERMKPIRDSMPKTASWQSIVQASYEKMIDLTAKYMFKATDVKPYDIYGCACAEIELDVLTGNLQITRVDLLEDTGQSMSPLVDVGQIEGAFMMGVGYWLTEKLEYDRRNGELMTNRTWTYKPPGAKDIPIDFRIRFLQNNVNESLGVLRSKATGEPALCMSIVVMFALRHAIDSVRMDNGLSLWYRLGSGNSPEVAFNASGINVDSFKLN